MQHRVVSSLNNNSSSTTTAKNSFPTFSTWDDYVQAIIQPEYIQHFHKNFNSGNYAAMRAFWSAPACQSASDIPPVLNGLAFVEEDKVSYIDKKKNRGKTKEKIKSNDVAASTSLHKDCGEEEETEKEATVATTLRGVLRQSLPQDVAFDLFQEIITKEECVYHWNVRGPRIFDTVTSVHMLDDYTNNNVRDDEEDGDVGGGSNNSKKKTDIIALQEYDCHDVIANYRPKGNPSSSETTSSTFANAMSESGYDGVFFLDPLKGRTPPSGLGLYWRRDVFEPLSMTNEEGTTTTVHGTAQTDDDTTGSTNDIKGGGNNNNNNTRGIYVLECGEETLHGALYNADLEEYWHPNSLNSHNQKPILMNAADRRNAGFATLRHCETGKIILVCVVHFMTTSRDGAKTNRYPGEVRAGELATMRSLLESRLSCINKNKDEKDHGSKSGGDDVNVLLLGDFNTDAKDAHYIFGGKIQRRTENEGTPTPVINTKDDKRKDECTTDTKQIREVNTGFDTSENHFFLQLSGTTLKEAFADVHQWGRGVGSSDCSKSDSNGGGCCTSRNAARIEWIDYVFHSNGMKPVQRSDCTTPSNPIPDEEHPSDHLPLAVEFEFQ